MINTCFKGRIMWVHIHNGTLFGNKENEISKFLEKMNGAKNESINLGNTSSDKCHFFIYRPRNYKEGHKRDIMRLGKRRKVIEYM